VSEANRTEVHIADTLEQWMIDFERPALKTRSLSATMARAAAMLDWLVINRP
jgi:hypothetical protein